MSFCSMPFVTSPHLGYMMTSAERRAARGLIGWSQQDLAKRSGVGTIAVHQLKAE
jgi:hypothetical protein